MTIDNSGRRMRFAVLVKPLALLSILLLPALAACTTDEGTNALADPSTFERTVMDPTLQGLDIIPQDPAKAAPERRAPLVIPKQMAALPPPSKDDTAALPADSDDPSVSTAGLSSTDLAKLRSARVIDLNSLGGRPLTETERRQLAARLQAANVQVAAGGRPLTLPPASYFSGYQGANALCKAADGTLVSLNDSRCPDKVRSSLHRAMPVAGSVTNEMQQQEYDMANGINPNDPNEQNIP